MQTPKDFALKGADSLTLAKKIVETLIEKKALDVRLYSVKEESSITDYYVNATNFDVINEISEKILNEV